MLMPRLVKLLPVALLIAGCATNKSREMILVDSYPSYMIKTIQSSPYEVSTWAQLRGISRADIRAIEIPGRATPFNSQTDSSYVRS